MPHLQFVVVTTGSTWAITTKVLNQYSTFPPMYRVPSQESTSNQATRGHHKLSVLRQVSECPATLVICKSIGYKMVYRIPDRLIINTTRSRRNSLSSCTAAHEVVYHTCGYLSFHRAQITVFCEVPRVQTVAASTTQGDFQHIQRVQDR